ncbi:MAG: hypothetical protein ABIK28_08405 [Planctomycetota bacterium]
MGNDISRNSSTFDGGGIRYQDIAKINLWNNTISENTARDGGGISFSELETEVFVNNMIWGNTATRNGGAMSFTPDFWYTYLDGFNNTFAHNTAACGGGIHTFGRVNIVLKNMIFWDNIAPDGPEIYMGNSPEPAKLKIRYSDVKGGVSSVYVGTGISFEWGAENIDKDPLFVDEAGHDFHLIFGSPCVDAGDLNAVIKNFDFENDPRKVDGKCDIGADAFHTHFYCTGDFTPGGVVTGTFIGFPHPWHPWETVLFIGAGIKDPPVSTLWGDFYLDAPWTAVEMGLLPFNGVIQVTQQIPGIVPTPQDVPMQALIMNELSNLFVLEVR